MKRPRTSKWAVSALLVFALCVLAGCGEAKREQIQAPAQGGQQDAVREKSNAADLGKIGELLAKCDAEIKVTPETDTAYAYFWTGNDLWGYMSKDSSYDKMITLAYVLGVKDTLGAVAAEMNYLTDVYLQAIPPELVNLNPSLVGTETMAHVRLILESKLAAAVDNPRGDKVTAGQVVDVVKKYLSDHPEERAMPASLLVWRSLSSLESAKSMAGYLESRAERLMALPKTEQ